MLKLSLIEESWGLSKWEHQDWESLTEQEKDESAYRMAVYAAQVHCMDRNIGRLVKALEQEGKLDNTLIFFLSDNGACAEPLNKELGGGTFSDINNPKIPELILYGSTWAQVSNTPYFRYKMQCYEGGLSTPLIVSCNNRFSSYAGSIRSVNGFFPDIIATIVEVAKAEYYKKSNDNRDIYPIAGKSLVSVIEGNDEEIHEYMCWEHSGNAAVKKDKWKAVREEEYGKWVLYNLESDRTETNDVGTLYKNVLDDLVAHWIKWSIQVNVYPKRK